MWEDNRNKRGGRWLLSLAKQQRHIELDRLWLETVSGGKGACVGLQEAVVSELVGWTLYPSQSTYHSPFGPSCYACLGRVLRNTVRRSVEPLSTSAPRGTRLLCGQVKQRTKQECCTSGESPPCMGSGGWVGVAWPARRPLEPSILALPSSLPIRIKGVGM